MLWAAGCGAKTGLEVPTLEDGGAIDARSVDGSTRLPDWRVSAPIRCGNCFSEPWCARGDRSGVPFCTETSQSPAGPNVPCKIWCGQPDPNGGTNGVYIDNPQQAINAFGQFQNAYCVGPAAEVADRTTCANATGRQFPWWLEGCFLSDQAFQRWAGPNANVSFGETNQARANVCPNGASYSCGNFPFPGGMGTTPARYSIFAGLLCPKGVDRRTSEPHPVCRREEIVAGVDALAAVVAARPLLGRYANLFGSGRFVGDAIPNGSTPGGLIMGGVAPFVCFAATQGIATEALAGIAVPSTDPSISQYGYRTEVLASTEVVIENGDVPPPSIPMAGAAYVYLEAGNFSLSWLRLTQPVGNTVTAGSYSISSSRMLLEKTWMGGHTAGGPAPNIALELSSTRAQVETSVNGQVRIARPIGEEGSAHFDGVDRIDLTARMKLDDANIWVRLNLHLRLLPRPTAVITNAPVQVECTQQPGGWAGASVSVTGTLTPAGSLGLWNLSGYNSADYATGLNATLQIGPQRFAGPPAMLTFSTYDGVLAEWASREIHVVDNQAPTIVSTQVVASCGWGYAASEQDPKHPALCATIPGIFSDICSSATAQIDAIRVYDYPTGVLIETRTFQYGTTCITPNVNYLDATMSNADYEVDWRAKDEWGNLSALRHWRGWFGVSPPTTTCTSATAVHTIFDN